MEMARWAEDRGKGAYFKEAGRSIVFIFFFSSRRRHTRWNCDWSSDVCSSDLDRLRIGEAVTVKVLRIDDARGKVTLSLKALEGDPWATVPGRLRERQVVRGRAARATEFGVFVELLPGVDGLLHASEIPRHRSAALREAGTAVAEIA